MKIHRIKLIAFGPFTDTELNLSAGQEGLHIVYGPNEAGKSSALRALRQILYGIPDRSLDDFIHPYAKIRIGAVLARSDGTVQEFIRRKGRLNTLRASDDVTIIDEAHLRTFLGGVDHDLFTTMFGIDHANLVRGGEEIIQGGGEIGRLLFAAGSGISNLRKVQEELQIESEILYKPAGQKPRINEAMILLKKNQKTLREVQLSGGEWNRHDMALREALEKKQEIDHDFDQKLRMRHRLERIKEALPVIAQRKELLNALALCADAVLLPPDFGDRRRDALTNLRIAENDQVQALASIKQIQEALEQLSIPETLLKNADLIEALYQELGSYRKAMKDRFRLVTQQYSLEADAKAILQELKIDVTLDQAEQFRLSKAESIRIQELCTSYERLLTRSQSTREEINKISIRIERLRKQLNTLEDFCNTDKICSAIESTRQQGNLEEIYQTECNEILRAEKMLKVALEKQALWKGSIEDIESLQMPAMETIDIYEKLSDEAQFSVSRESADLDKIENTLLELSGQIEKLRLEQEVPTEEDLNQARHKRDAGWQLIRRILNEMAESAKQKIDFVSAFPRAENLEEAYECSVRQADEIADRLRREADRVAKKANLLADRETLKSQSFRYKNRLDAAESKLKDFQGRWLSVWEPIGIYPRSPREMRAWLIKQTALVEQAGNLRLQKNKVEDLKVRIERHRRQLSECLIALDQAPAAPKESLNRLVARCQQFAERMDKLRNEHEQLNREISREEAELREAQSRSADIDQELSHWESEWAKAIRPLNLDAGASPAQANAVVEDLKNLFVKLKDAKDRRRRIRSIDKDAEEFKTKVFHLVEREVPDIMKLSVEEATMDFNARLIRARTAKAQQQSLEKQLQQEEQQRRSAESRIAEIHAQLSVMCEEAGCKNYEDLPIVEERSAQRQQIQFQIKQLEQQLHNLSAGAVIDEFIREAQAINPDGIEAQIEKLGEEIGQLDHLKSELDQAIGRERNELGNMTGSARAAELAEESQALLAQLDTDVHQYARLQLASAVLGQAIENYREKYQGPILKRSSALFAHMTLRSFEGLRLEFNEKGDAVLVGVRPGGKDLVNVGGMSEGTADQLYLAVRLASLEAYLEKNEAMPFIVDDILIKFDDQRAMATLQVLAELSRRTQIIFFTHHRHLVEMAEACLDPTVLYKHSLAP
ncbi:MAG: AAA family ATPase [Desulfobacterales bacterium]|nr:AAA family ATPase [Desulfobacterales bacterium]